MNKAALFYEWLKKDSDFKFESDNEDENKVEPNDFDNKSNEKETLSDSQRVQ
jgi:hypothetical protein